MDNMCGTPYVRSRFVKRLGSPTPSFMPEQGFSSLIETDAGQRSLADAGASEAVILSNLKAIGQGPKDIDAKFLSHGHCDHGRVGVVHRCFRPGARSS